MSVELIKFFFRWLFIGWWIFPFLLVVMFGFWIFNSDTNSYMCNDIKDYFFTLPK
jgi:hypothetical protein